MNAPQPAAPAEPSRVSTILFNPSYYLAGGASLLIGIAVLLLSGLVGWLAHTHFDGVLDIHTGREAPLWIHLGEGLVDWVAMGLLLYIAGRVLSASKVRAVDVFGTQAIARFPYLVAAVATLTPAFQRQGAAMVDMAERVRGGESATAVAMSSMGQQVPGDLLVFLAIVVFNLLMLVWMVALMYRAYACTCNLKGARAIVSFIVVLIVAEILSKIGVGALFMLARP